MPQSKDKPVKNAHNMIIGWLREYPDRIIATHYLKGYVGCYNKNTDITIDAKGKIYCYGDGSSDLIRQVK